MEGKALAGPFPSHDILLSMGYVTNVLPFILL
jgi:hypothetical protein